MGIFSFLSNLRLKSRLSYRILSYILICSALFTFISTAFQLYIEYKKDVESVEDGINQIRESYLNFISLSLWDMDESQLNMQLQGALLLPNIQYLEVREIHATKEEVFSTAGIPKNEGVDHYQFPLIYQAGQEKMNIGNLYVTVNLEGVYQRLYDRVALILTTQAIKTFLWAFCVLAIFQYVIMRNLNQIAGYLKQLNVTRLNIPLTLNRKISASTQQDELEHVVMAINSMRKNLMQSMAERQQAEEELRQSERYKEIQNQIANVFLTVPDEEMYGEVLAVVLQAMKSKFGLFGFIEANGDLVIPSMTREIWNECQVPAKSMVFPQNTWGDSLWGRSIKEQKALFSDGPFHTPEGHVHIDYFLAAPIIFWNETIGILSVANKESGYTAEDQRLLESITGYISPILNARLQRDRKEQERKQTEQALSESEALFRTSFENATVGICLVGIDGRFLNVNRKLCKIFGYTNVELGRMQFNDITYSEDKDIGATFVKYALAGEIDTTDFEKRYLKKNGQIIWAHVSSAIIRNLAGEPQYFITHIQDITERKAAEEALRQLNMELDRRVLDRTAQFEAANKELEGFVYSISHDLRAPLRHIDGFLELLQRRIGPAMDDQSRQYMARVTDSARRMGALIDDLLSFSRMGRFEMSSMPVNLNDLGREVILELQPDVQGRDIRWEIADLPTVTGDRAMLRIVLVNLISNALKFTRPRQEAQIEIGSLPGQNSEAVIFIRDNGVGFDMNYADKLFNVFQRLHRVDEFEGTGIGLANVHRIINRHGGRTWATGELNQGATFFFSLPRIQQGR
jgi:PAS domain S-box-containing protein